MMKIYGFNLSPNTQKVLFTAEELGLDYEYVALDPTRGEHKTPEHLARNPWGKVPVLESGSTCLIESNSISRYLARQSDSALYPHKAPDIWKLDQMIDLMSFHPVRWVTVYVWEEYIKALLMRQPANAEALAEARGFLDQQLPEIDRRLGEQDFLCGDGLTLADTISFPAFADCVEHTSCDLSAFPQVLTWIDRLGNRPGWQRVQQRLGI